MNTKTYSFINILGLSAGLASFVIVLLYLNYELSYDKWNPELEKVYRISMKNQGDIQVWTPAPLAYFLAEKYPEVAAATYIQSSGDYEVLLSANDKNIYQKGFITVDSLFLEVFPYTLIKGDTNTALNPPNAVVISEELSKKLFGDANPMGKTIRIYNAIEAVVTGVLKEPETPSHLNPQLLMRSPYEKQNYFWNNHSFHTYIKLKHPVSQAKMEDAINRIYFNERLKKDEQAFNNYKETGVKTTLFSDAVPDIHNFPKYGPSNITTVSVLFILAILLLLVGSINFSNLTIAKSMGRAKEVGMRKVLGSGRGNLIFQFMGETALQCFISLCIALLVVYMSLPGINNAFNLELNLWDQDQGVALITQIMLCLLLITLLSGLYPAFVLSRFNISKVLKGNYSTGKQGMFFRNSLIVFQFVVTTFFIIAILVVDKQINYIQSKDKGFAEEQVIRIEAQQITREENFAKTRNSLLSIPGVSHVAKTTLVPGDAIIDSSTHYFNYEEREIRLGSVKVSTDYFKTLNVPLIKGRYFNDTYADQNTRSAVINETAAKKLNVDNPLGKTISFNGCDNGDVQVVGVVKDFNVQGYETSVQPTIYTIGNKACMYQSGGAILVKLNTAEIQTTIAAIEEEWKGLEPGFPIRYSFIDDNFQQLFSSYFRLQKIIRFFGGIAILISIMGLFALTSFILKQRNKEIGIRKVLGANIRNLTSLISKDFIRLVVIAAIISVPIGWLAMDKWLQNFAYHTSISWWVYAMATIIVLLIALATVSFQTIKAALQNPVKSLRTE